MKHSIRFSLISLVAAVLLTVQPSRATVTPINNGSLTGTLNLGQSSTTGTAVFPPANLGASSGNDYGFLSGTGTFKQPTALNAISSIALLRSQSVAGLANGSSITVSGYYTANDGGGGVYVWNSTSTATDNGGTVIQATGVTTGRWILQYSGPLNAKWFGAHGDGTNQDSGLIANAIAALPAKGGTVYLPTGVYLVGSTIVLPANCTLLGQYAGNGAAGAQDKSVGSVLKWNGAASGTIVSIVASTNVCLEGVNLDGASTTGVTGILIDSNSSNAGPENIIVTRWTAWDCAVGLQWGTTGATPSYQNDSVKISEFKVYNTTQGFGSGIVINSDQACQGSIIENGICENLLNGINVQHSGGSFKIRGVLFGSLLGTDIRIDQSIDLLVENCHHEGGVKAVDIVGSNFVAGTITFVNNRWFNEPVTVQRQANIVSISNAGGSTATCTVAGTTVVSISDTFNSGSGWTMTDGKQLRMSALGAMSADGTITAKTGPGFAIDYLAGQIRSLAYKTSGVNRWLAYCTDDAETGSNAGSDYALVAYDDSGNFLWAPIVARRKTGAVSIRGTQTNDDASAGNYGEWQQAATGAPGAALSNGVAANVVSLVLTPGDWEITGNCVFAVTGGTVTALIAGSNSTSATFPLPVFYSSLFVSGSGISAAPTAIIPTERYTVATGTTTTVYLVAQANFSAGTVNVYGFLAARRMR